MSAAARRPDAAGEIGGSSGAGPLLPSAFADRMRDLLGRDEAAALLEALSRPPARGLRVHPGRTDLARLAARTGWSLAPLPWCRQAAILDPGGDAPGRHPLHEAGAFYLQDPSATAPAAALAVRPGERVIDLAAAPGGKATQLAADLDGRGLLVANDATAGRIAALARNLERFGAHNAVVVQEPPATLARRWPGRFDAVLLDAPCSGEGMFRKSPEAVLSWSESAVHACAARQADLLDAAADLLAPGGRLLYATCTFAPEENEGAVLGLLRRRPDLRAVPLALAGLAPGRPDWVGADTRLPAGACGRLWPHHAPGDGHFLALLVRDAGAAACDPAEAGSPASQRHEARPDRGAAPTGRGRRRSEAATASAAGRQARDAWRRFSEASLRPGALRREAAEEAGEEAGAEAAEHELVESGGLLWARAPLAAHELAGLRVLRPGLALGRTRAGGRFEPAHALAQALRPDEVRARLELDPAGPTVLRYLRGEELDLAALAAPDVRAFGLAADDPDGHLLVTVADAPLGWALRRGARLRNRYPKGLRRPA